MQKCPSQLSSSTQLNQYSTLVYTSTATEYPEVLLVANMSNKSLVCFKRTSRAPAIFPTFPVQLKSHCFYLYCSYLCLNSHLFSIYTTAKGSKCACLQVSLVDVYKKEYAHTWKQTVCVLRQLIQIKDVLLVKLTSRISTEFCTNVCVCMCTSVSANLPKEGSMKKPSAHSWLFPDASVGRQGCVWVSVSLWDWHWPVLCAQGSGSWWCQVRMHRWYSGRGSNFTSHDNCRIKKERMNMSCIHTALR